MKNFKIAIVFIIALFAAIILTPNLSFAATHDAATEDTLRTAVSEAVSGDTINLKANIALTSNIGITDKNLTINGNGFTISAAEGFQVVNSDGSLITAGANSRVTLKNVNLANAVKYGAQAYNGGYLVLDGVTISGCKFGGVLVNAGTLEIVDLTLYRNGGDNNNGIELAKGLGIDTGDNQPTIRMNGKLTSTEDENVIYVAVNDNLTGFEVENTEDSEYKLYINDGKVVVADEENNILYESNKKEGVTVEGETFTPNHTVTVYLNKKTVKISVKEGTKLTKKQVEDKIDLKALGLDKYKIEGFYSDESYKTAFKFDETVTKDVFIYAKLKSTAKVDNTPKTGTEATLAIAILTATASLVGISYLRRKEY